MRHVWSVLVLAFLALACESIVGTDFGSYSGKCSPLADKCPAGSPCVFDAKASAFVCQPHSGMKYQDEACSSETDCTPGFACALFPNATTGHCTKYCSDPMQCPTGRCIPFNITRTLADGTEVGGCGPLGTPCDPILAVDPTCMPYRCTLYDTDYTVCDGLEMMVKNVNDPCDYVQQCPQSTLCFGAPSYCRKYCDVDMPDCPANTTCQPFVPAVTLGARKIGLCR